MPVPLKFLIIAAEIAQHEKTHQAVKAVWTTGSDFLSRRQQGKAQLATEINPVPSAPRRATPSWRSSLERRWRFRPGQSGDLIRFQYTDEHGLVMHRMVGNWSCRGGDLTGYCLNRKAETSFAISRIGKWEEIPVRVDDADA